MRADLAARLGQIRWNLHPLWGLAPRVDHKNDGLVESNLLSLSYGQVVRKDINEIGGLRPDSYETYNIIAPGDTVLRMTDLQNDQRSIRTGLATERGIITSAYITVRPDGDKVEPRFLHSVLRAYDIKKTFYEMGVGVRQTLKYAELADLPIPLPPRDTQRAIADYLDRETGEIDAMLAKLNSLSEALAERKVLVIQNLTQRSDSGVRWTAVPTAHLFSSIGSGTTPKGVHYYAESGSGIPWVTTSELRESVIVETTQDVTEEAVGALSALRVHPRGSVVIAMYGATIGRLAMLGVDAAMNQACCAFSSPRNVDSRFFYYALWGQREELILEANGGGQPNISQGFLRRWRVPCPPLVEQRRIADRLDEVTGRVDAMLATIDELKALLVERRAALITDVVTGRKKIPS